jgi:hypothetical protein
MMKRGAIATSMHMLERGEGQPGSITSAFHLDIVHCLIF